MKLLQEFHQSDFFDEPDADPSAFSHRYSARAIVHNEQGEIALMYVAKHAYYKLPGGGIEQGEDTRQALERELLEELGCKAEVIDEVGKTIEYRDTWEQKQTSYCFLAKQIGKVASPSFTEDELADGFAVVWTKDLQAAIHLVKQNNPQDYGGQFMRARDLAFLQAAYVQVERL